MDTALKIHDDPLIYEFENEDTAADYDAWFRAKVQNAMDSSEPAIPHDEVVSRMRARLAERLKNAG